jgi:hypothetical protein
MLVGRWLYAAWGHISPSLFGFGAPVRACSGVRALFGPKTSTGAGVQNLDRVAHVMLGRELLGIFRREFDQRTEVIGQIVEEREPGKIAKGVAAEYSFGRERGNRRGNSLAEASAEHLVSQKRIVTAARERFKVGRRGLTTQEAGACRCSGLSCGSRPGETAGAGQQHQ